MWLLNVIKPNISLLVQHFGYENHLFLVLMKLKFGLMNRDLAIQFNLIETKVSKIFRKCIKPLTPAGAVSFLSYGWGGHASDKMIFN